MNLSALDETLLHQAPLPFEYAATSDHRFFDRHMGSAYASDGSAGVTFGMGLYKNMNVIDGFAAVQRGATVQHNLRLSRALRPQLDMQTGPLRIEIVEPLKKLRYVLDGSDDYPHRFDLTFGAFQPPYLEEPHFGRIDGRLATDYLRYCQNGHLNGVVMIGEEEIRVENWFMWRDHSWGVRPNVGGFDPFTGTTGQGTFPSAIRSGGKGLLLFGFGFATPEFGGYISLIENGLGERLYLTGFLGRPNGESLKVVDAEYDVVFVGKSRDFSRMDIRFTTEDGKKWNARNTAVGRTWIFKGLGYDGGYNDGKGQGVYRAKDLHQEYDAYDVSELGKPRLADGTISNSSHREQHCRIDIEGAKGDSYIPLILIGKNHRYDIT
jgi:hypothetical protein